MEKECEHFILEDALIDETEFCALTFKKCADCKDCYFKKLKNKTNQLNIATSVLQKCTDGFEDDPVVIMAKNALEQINFLKKINNKIR